MSANASRVAQIPSPTTLPGRSMPAGPLSCAAGNPGGCPAGREIGATPGGLPCQTRRVLSAVVRRVRPPSPTAGRLAGQSLLFATGEGTFLTGSAVFFTQIVGLSAAQVGLGLTVAGAAAFLAAWPAGKTVDRFGLRRMWAVSAAGQAAVFAVWPFITGFSGYLAMSIAMEVIGSFGNAAFGAYSVSALPPHERVTSRAYVYSALNVGYTLGSVLGGVALAFRSNTVLHALPWLTTGLFLLNAVLISRLPQVRSQEQAGVPPAEPGLTDRSGREVSALPAPSSGWPDTPAIDAGATPYPHPAPGPDPVAPAAAGPSAQDANRAGSTAPGPLRNLGWLASSFFGGVLWTNQVLLNVVIPLWLVQRTDAPRVLLAFLFGTNTVMCIVLPMAAARGVKDVPTALRAIRISGVFFVISCLVTLTTHETVGWLTIALVWLGHVTVTGAELFLSAASWSLDAELMDPHRRGEYQGANQLGSTLGKVWAPAAYTFLAMSWGAAGWLVIAVIAVLATAALHPSARAAQRFLTRYGLTGGLSGPAGVAEPL